MVSEQNKPAQSVWIGEHEKIASFHPVEGYRKHTDSSHERFLEFLHLLQQQGFRFQ